MQKEITENEQNLLKDAGQRLKRHIEEAQMLQLVEKTFNSVEQARLGCNPAQYDNAAAFAAAQNFLRAINDNDSERLEELENQLSFEIEKWRADIVSRDARLETYNLRQYFEKIYQPIEKNVFGALARFYRSLPHDEQTQSKYDFAITSLYAVKSASGRRELRAEGERLVSHLKEMFAPWDAAGRREFGDEAEVFRVAGRVRAFIDEASEVATLEDIITRDLFNRIRALKREIGEALYAPEATAAFIECNVVVGNKFAELVSKNVEQNLQSPAARLDFGELFRDSPSKTASQIEDVLDNLPAEELDEEYVEQMSRLVRLLQFAEEGADEPQPLTETPAESEIKETSEVTENFIKQLSQIPEHSGNAEVLGELRRNSWSAEIHALDLQMFLAALPGAENDIADVRRRALTLVLEADKLSSGALSASDAIDSETERNLTDLLTEMQKLSSELQRLMKPNASNGASQDAEALLYVSNHLLKARLGLQTAIVRRSADEIAQQQEAARQKALREREFISMAAVKPAAKPIRRAMVSKRLIAAAALMVFCAFGVRFALTTNGASDIKRDPSVVVLNSTEMPDGAFLADARVTGDTLIGVVTDQWNVLSEKEKREKLTAWVQYAKKYSATAVMLINESGEPKGGGSQEAITTDADFES